MKMGDLGSLIFGFFEEIWVMGWDLSVVKGGFLGFDFNVGPR